MSQLVEIWNIVDIRKNVVFQYVCDGFVDLSAKLIDGRNETDESECEQWECDNIYTHCDDTWNCLNSADELDCDYFPGKHIDCSPQQHRCVSP